MVLRSNAEIERLMPELRADSGCFLVVTVVTSSLLKLSSEESLSPFKPLNLPLREPMVPPKVSIAFVDRFYIMFN